VAVLERRGVADSFEEFVTTRGLALRRFAYLMCGDRYIAEDLVQEVLAKVHQKWARIERADSPEAYARRAIANQHISWRRRRASTEVMVSAVPEHTGDGDMQGEVAAREEVWSMLSKLSRAQRAVLVLRFYEDLSYDEIAQVLGCSTATVRVHASRALGRLREGIEPPANDLTARPVLRWGAHGA